MPLRDHFQPPITKYGSWTSLHGMWPATIVQQIRKQLPPGFVAAPRVHLGQYFEVDFAAFEEHSSSEGRFDSSDGTATATVTDTLARIQPTWAVETDPPEEDVFEVEIYRVDEDRTLVAVLELVSPANKDRPEMRRAFAGKCGALLRKGVSVSIVDVVTMRHANLYAELMAFIGHPDPHLSSEASPVSPVYVSSCRWTVNLKRPRARLEAWYRPMAVGEPLPALPIWLGEAESVIFDLDRSYEQACEDLSIP